MAAKEEYKREEVVRVLITHYATKGFMKKAKEKGVIVIQIIPLYQKGERGGFSCVAA